MTKTPPPTARVVIGHADSCPVSQPGFVPVEGKTFCNCDFTGRLRAYLETTPKFGQCEATLKAGPRCLNRASSRRADGKHVCGIHR